MNAESLKKKKESKKAEKYEEEEEDKENISTLLTNTLINGVSSMVKSFKIYC